MPISDFLRALSFRFALNVDSHLIKAESFFIDRRSRRTLARTCEIGTRDVYAQYTIFAKESQAHLVGLKLPRRIIQYIDSEKALAFSLVQNRHIQLLNDSVQMSGCLISLQADCLSMPPISIIIRNVIAAIVFGEAMQAVRDDESVVLPAPLEYHFMARQMAQLIAHSGMLEIRPFLNRVNVKFRQTNPLDM